MNILNILDRANAYLNMVYAMMQYRMMLQDLDQRELAKEKKEVETMYNRYHKMYTSMQTECVSGYIDFPNMDIDEIERCVNKELDRRAGILTYVGFQYRLYGKRREALLKRS